MARVLRTKIKKKVLKNSSNQISHSIQKIKDNEKKYTIILVTFFFLLFCIIGYYSLRINENIQINYIPSNNNQGTTISGKNITLTNDDIMTDDRGLKTQGLTFTIENHQDCSVNYQVVIKTDDFIIDECGCRNNLFPLTSIRYSYDGKTINTLSSTSSIIYKGTIKAKERVDNSDTSRYKHPL